MRGIRNGTLAAAVLAGSMCFAAPEPAIVPAAGQWTVNAMFTHPQQIVLRAGPQEKAERFWYTILTITNKTGEDIEFYPRCDLMTDTFHILPASKGVSPTVFELIKQRHQRKYRFLENLEQAGNRILQGEDNTKDLAVIWPDFDAQAKGVKVFIAGLSNETAMVTHPVAKDENGQAVKVFLRKTLELNYTVKGDPALRSDLDLSYVDKRWVMR
jgi:hypothetical protein